jgi:ribonuclease R
MEIDGQGRVVSYEIFPSVIKVHTRLSYNLVRRLLEDKDEELNRQYFYLLDKLAVMEKLCHILRGRRMHRGAIDFDFPEIKVKLDAQGKPVEIIKRVRTIAESIIEEFMLVSNETVAEHMQQRKYPFIFRVHEEPDGDKMVKLNNLLNNFGQTLAKTDKIQPKALQKILARIAGLPEERIISMVMLRSLKQARYDAENLGHFGLAASFYTHFTSPIRRYPDLIVHRLLWESFQQTKLSPARRERLLSLLPEIALHSSQRERGATEAERETVDLKKVEYMAEFIGEEFSGTISGVTAFGLFVELDNGIEGLVHVSSMDDDYYHFSEERYSLVGGRTGKTFQLGEQVKVILNKVNAEERTIDFSLTGEFLSGKIRSKGINNKPNSRPPTKPAVNPPGKQKAATPRWKKRKNVTKPRTK